MRKFGLILASLIGFTIPCLPQADSNVVVPPFDDRYCRYVRELESGHNDIDYADFRNSFLESRQFLIASESIARYDSLKNEMYARMKSSNYAAVLSLAKRLLGIDYTGMMVHKILGQTYNILGDTVRAQRYRNIEFGLLKSIVANRDGTSPQSAWPVIQVSEEYFVLQMLGVSLKEQNTVSGSGIYDEMIVMKGGEEKVYYFEISKVIQSHNRGGTK